MQVDEAVLTVLRDAGEPLHRTTIQDRALRAGYLDPFDTPDVRRQVARALQALARGGEIVRTSKGTYAVAPAGPP
jgi:hypothetical protein